MKQFYQVLVVLYIVGLVTLPIAYNAYMGADPDSPSKSNYLAAFVILIVALVVGGFALFKLRQSLRPKKKFRGYQK